MIVIAGTYGVFGLQDGPVLSALFKQPCGLVVDKQGVIIVCDYSNHCLRKISHDGVVSKLAGSTEGYEDGLGSEARFKFPAGVALDEEGNILVTDYGNHRVRKVTSQGVVTTLAGSTPGLRNGPVQSAQFNWPSKITVDQHGNMLVVESGNHCIRKITKDGVVSTVAGTGRPGYQDGQGITASFNYPSDIAVDRRGNIVVSETGNNRIRLISAQGDVSTLAGSTPGYKDDSGARACFSSPNAIVVDDCGDVLVADINNRCIRRVTPLGVVSTVMRLDAYSSLAGLALDRDRNLIFTDFSKYQICKLVFPSSIPPSSIPPSSIPPSSIPPSKFIRGPAGSAFGGGMFELIVSDFSEIRFAVPIFHCNVNPQSGAVSFPFAWSADTDLAVITAAVVKLLQFPDLAPSAIKNQEAFALWKNNRLEFNSRARREAADSWQRLVKDTVVLPNALEVLLPSHIMLDRKAQHQIFSQLALDEIEKHFERKKQEIHQAHFLEHKLNESFGNMHEANLVQEETDMAEANMFRATMTYQLSKTLQELTTLENPLHMQKMKWLEKKLDELYLSKLIPALKAVDASVMPTFLDKVPTTTEECFAMMTIEAGREQLRLAKLINTCMSKYQSLFGRFDMLKNINLDEQKEEKLVQPVVSTVEFFLTQAKLLEPSFRSFLQELTDTFNQSKLPSLILNHKNLSTHIAHNVFTQVRMANGLHGSVFFGPPKSAERVRQKGDAHRNCDYLRATVVMADPLLLSLFYFAIADSANFKARKMNNKHNLMELNQPPNLHVNFEFCEHICEVQFILEDFFLIKAFSHKSYEIARVGGMAGTALEEAVSRIVVEGVYVVHSHSQ